ncbi:MAG: hypothetical protein WCP22_00725, partial [Chlamydiota bacterium]
MKTAATLNGRPGVPSPTRLLLRAIAPPVTMLALAAALGIAGCGKADEYRQRYHELQEQTRRKISDLDAARRADLTRYEQRIIGYEAELRRLTAELTAAKQFPAAKGTLAGRSPAPAPGVAQGKDSPARALAALAASGDAASGEEATVASLLEQFIQDYEDTIDEGRRAQFRNDFAAYIARLKEQPGAVPVPQRKDARLRDLRARLESASNDRERELLQSRIGSIENASAEDLPGVLDYYQRLDSIQSLNRLMEEYNIPRDELSAAGIEPPPRNSWQPEAREIAGNLKDFADRYEPLAPPEQRAQFREEFDACAANLTARPSDAQVVEMRNAMLGDLRTQAAAATGRQQERINGRI